MKMDNNSAVSVESDRSSRYAIKNDDDSSRGESHSSPSNLTQLTANHRSSFIYASPDHGVRLRLQDLDLWGKFNSVTNEMIVTKSGR